MKRLMIILFVIILFPLGYQIQTDTVAKISESETLKEMPVSEELTEPVISEETDEFGNPVDYYSLTSNFPLYAMIKSENIYLYGISGSRTGMVLFQDGEATYFLWPGLTPRLVLPKLSYFDYDGDGENELAVTLYHSSGTGVALMDLHILKIGESKYGNNLIYTDYSLLSKSINEWFTKDITAEHSNDLKTVIVNYNGNLYNYSGNDKDGVDYDTAGSLYGIKYGDIVKFYFNDEREITVEISIGLNFEKYAIVYYFGKVTANVNFDGEKFYLSDYTFSMNDS